MKKLIKSRFVIPMKGKVIEDAGVLVDGQKIEGVYSCPPPDGIEYDELIDLGNSILIPGFVNAHTHSAMVLFRGLADDLPLMEWLQNHIWPMENRFVDETFIRIGVELALVEMIRSGTVAFADMYFYQEVAAEVIRKAGLRAVLGEAVIDFPTPRFKTPDDALKFTREFIQSFKDDELITPTVAPHAPYSCSKELLHKSKALADEFGGLPVLIHVAETQDNVNDIMSRYGKRPVEYLDSIGFLDSNIVAAHMVWLSEKEIEIFVEKRGGMVHNPSSNLKLASGIAPVHRYIKSGMRVSLGTDGAASNNDLDMVNEMHIASMIQKVKEMDPTAMPAWDAFHIATQGGADVIGLGDKIGTIEAGKFADMVAFNIDVPHLTPLFNPISHLVYAAKSSDIHFVMVNGRILMENKELKTIDEERAIARANELAEKIKRSDSGN